MKIIKECKKCFNKCKEKCDCNCHQKRSERIKKVIEQLLVFDIRVVEINEDKKGGYRIHSFPQKF